MLEIPVSFLPSENSKLPVKGSIKLNKSFGDIVLSFFPDAESDVYKTKHVPIELLAFPEFIYPFSDFSQMKVTVNKKLLVEIYGKITHLYFYFDSSTLLQQFYQFAKSQYYFVTIPGTPEICQIIPLTEKKEYFKPYFTNPNDNNKNSLFRIKRENMEFELSTDFAPKQFTANDFEQTKDNIQEMKEKLYDSEMDITVAKDAFYTLLSAEGPNKDLSPEDMKKLYFQTKTHWSCITKRQWDNSEKVRAVVEELEKDIQDNAQLFSKYEKAGDAIPKMVFNIYMTLSFLNWDKGSYTNGMIKYIPPFLDIYIKDIIPNDDPDKCSIILYKDDKALPIEEVENELFWVLYGFYLKLELNNLIKPTVTPKFIGLNNSVYTSLYTNYPDLLQLLKQKGMLTLDFIVDDISLFFTNTWNNKDIIKLWISSLTIDNFIEKFILSILYCMAAILIDKDIDTSEDFAQLYHDSISIMNLDLLLINAKMISL